MTNEELEQKYQTIADDARRKSDRIISLFGQVRSQAEENPNYDSSAWEELSNLLGPYDQKYFDKLLGK